MPDKASPVIYIFYGDDDYAIATRISQMIAKMGEPATAELNTTHLEGRSISLEDLRNATFAMPFLTERRLVVVNDPLANLRTLADQQAFLKLLENIPKTTALVLVIRDERKGSSWETIKAGHWLVKWVEEQEQKEGGQAVYLRPFPIPSGGELIKFIQGQAKRFGGDISPRAASLLADLIGENPRIISAEIQKLLAYVNYSRTVDIEDVEDITINIRQENVFDFVDTLGQGYGKKAIAMLKRLLENHDALYIFAMVIRQFRLLIQTKEILENGGRDQDVMKQLKIHFPGIAQKLISQANRFSLSWLENAYRLLLKTDEAIKTGQQSDELALYTLVAILTT